MNWFVLRLLFFRPEVKGKEEHNLKKENDILETTLSIAENGYSEAYHFLLDAYEKSIENYGPQTLYFLACLADGANMPEKSVNWLRKSITFRQSHIH